MTKAQIKYSFYWGALMYIFMVFVWPYLDGDVISFKKILTGIPIWFGCGFLQGYIFAKYNTPVNK
jgi:hypothetical protein